MGNDIYIYTYLYIQVCKLGMIRVSLKVGYMVYPYSPAKKPFNGENYDQQWDGLGYPGEFPGGPNAFWSFSEIHGLRP